MKILDNGKKLLSNWSQKHVKLLTVLYTLIVLMAGVLIGGHYEGQSEDGTYYYHVMDVTFYGGVISNDKHTGL